MVAPTSCGSSPIASPSSRPVTPGRSISPQNRRSSTRASNETPLFDDVSVRRAVNFAVDRGAIAALFGGRGFPTCQILPTAFPGYVPYCPYTRDPGRTWTRPDLAKARELIARSGTAGSRVVVWRVPKPSRSSLW